MKTSKYQTDKPWRERNLSSREQLELVRGTVYVLSRALEQEDAMSAGVRAKLKKQIATLYKHCDGTTYSTGYRGGRLSLNEMQRSIVGVFDLSVAELARHGDEEHELERATYQISVKMDSPFAPDQCHGRPPPSRALVLACLQAFTRRRGQRIKAGKSKPEALLDLFVHLGIATASGTEAARSLIRRAKPRKKPRK